MAVLSLLAGVKLVYQREKGKENPQVLLTSLEISKQLRKGVSVGDLKLQLWALWDQQ